MLPNKMATTRSEGNSDLNTKPKPRTAVNGRFGFEDLRETQPGVIEFGIGAPSFPTLAKLKPLLTEATKQRMESEECGHMFQYGAIRGDRVYIQELAKFLSEKYKDPVNSDNLVCTCGATSGLRMLSIALFKSGDYVFVEDPTYFIAIKIFRDDLGLNVISVPTDDHGVNVKAFEQLILDHQDKLNEPCDKQPYRAMFYSVPIFNNPKTVSLTPERCKALIKVLRKYNIIAVCDDVYNILNFGSEQPPKRLFSYDDRSDSDYKGHVVSNGSFSKIVGPGMRLGWFEGPEIVLEKVIFSAEIVSGGGVNQYTSAIMGTALRNKILSSYITDIVNSLKRKMEVMCNALDKYAKPNIKYRKPMGGYFIWAELPADCDAEAFQKYCVKNYKVSVRPGQCFSPCANFKNFIRLSFAFIEEEEIDKGIEMMATALQNFLKL